MEKNNKLILLRFHARGDLGHGGRIQIDLDIPPESKTVAGLIEDIETQDWPQIDAERLRMVIYGYFPNVTIDKLEDMILKRLTTRQITKELERRTR